MKQFFRESSVLNFIVTFQFTALLIYLNINVINVGEIGTALPFLIAYAGLSSLLIFICLLNRKIHVRFHMFYFFLLISWVAFRVIIDLEDLEYLKQITVATTGGMLLFYMVGASLGVSHHRINFSNDKVIIEKYIILLFSILIIWMLYSFSKRLHDSIFYLQGVDGGYQRPGNFLSISFIVISFAYINLVLKQIAQLQKIVNKILWLVIYTTSMLMSLVGSQLFGSNSATAVILGIYLITLVMSFIIAKKSMWLSYLKQKLALPWSKKLVNNMTFMALVGLAFFVGLLVLIIVLTGFDITSLRLLGFGSGTNNSLLSRFEILLETGANQLDYAPLLGNINVAYLTTGEAGKTLHTFFPYVVANLGLVGLTIVLMLFSSIFLQLYRESVRGKHNGLIGYKANMLAIYSIFIFTYVVFFANISTGLSWAVLWFTLGFISKPFGFSERV